MSVGLVAVGISTVVGVVLGAVSGYFGGVADMIIMAVWMSSTASRSCS